MVPIFFILLFKFVFTSAQIFEREPKNEIGVATAKLKSHRTPAKYIIHVTTKQN